MTDIQVLALQCISYSADFINLQPRMVVYRCAHPELTKYSRHQSIERLHLSNSTEIEGAALPNSTPLQSQMHSKPDTNRCPMSHDLFPVSANEKFGLPHRSLKSTEPVWSVNRKSCGFESIGIVFLSKKFGPGSRKSSTIQSVMASDRTSDRS